MGLYVRAVNGFKYVVEMSLLCTEIRVCCDKNLAGFFGSLCSCNTVNLAHYLVYCYATSYESDVCI